MQRNQLFTKTVLKLNHILAFKIEQLQVQDSWLQYWGGEFREETSYLSLLSIQ